MLPPVFYRLDSFLPFLFNEFLVFIRNLRKKCDAFDWEGVCTQHPPVFSVLMVSDRTRTSNLSSKLLVVERVCTNSTDRLRYSRVICFWTSTEIMKICCEGGNKEVKMWLTSEGAKSNPKHCRRIVQALTVISCELSHHINIYSISNHCYRCETTETICTRLKQHCVNVVVGNNNRLERIQEKKTLTVDKHTEKSSRHVRYLSRLRI